MLSIFGVCGVRTFRIFDVLFAEEFEDLVEVGRRWVEWEGRAGVTCLFYHHHHGVENIFG
jgi:hypothetical protein